MKNLMRLLTVLVVICIAVSCTSGQAGTYSLIPKPVKLEAKQGQFVFNAGTRIVLPNGDEDMYNAVSVLSERLRLSAGLNVQITNNSSGNIKPGKNMIYCTLSPMHITNDEGYDLKIKKGCIEIGARTPAGIFYAMQTLRQLLPPEIERDGVMQGMVWSVPCAVIKDEPRFPYRGVCIDVVRHFSTVEALKRHIDNIAFHKINRLHLHLTDDQGWRVEIKKYPKFTEIGAWRTKTYNEEKGQFEYVGRYGGYYTHEDIRDLVAYAKKNFITIIPEIDMPGHSSAGVASYPELSCSGAPWSIDNGWSGRAFCAGKESTFEILNDVLAEVMELFPGEYVHIGGDECNKRAWEKCPLCLAKVKELGLPDVHHGLQSYFIKRIEKFVNSKGKKIIGWDEILDGGLAPNATVMSWRGMKGGIAAAKQGHDVIMTPVELCYFNFYQSYDFANQPNAWGNGKGETDAILMEQVYGFDPVPKELSASEAKHILGGQCCLWRECIRTDEHLELMMFPRLAALSEVLWTPGSEKFYDNYMKRLTGNILKHYDAMNINYSKLDIPIVN